MVKQLELPMARVRVRLEDEPGGAGPNNQVMEFPAEDQVIDPDAFLPKSAWETKEDPPCPGWWEVTDHKTGTLLARWWFDGVWWKKGDPRVRGQAGMNRDQFRSQYAWRGLREPHADVYPCPPYASKDLVDRAMSAGRPIKTTYIRVTATADGLMPLSDMAAAMEPSPRQRVRL